MLSTLSSSVIRDRWVLKKKVGKGTFCEMFLGRSIIPFDVEDSQVAIKIQAEDVEKNVINTEANVLKALSASGLQTVPRYIKTGKHENRDFMVMELLSGEDMAHLRDRIRSTTGMRLLALPGAIYLSQQMLKCIQGIHEAGYIHRDIKPANFIRRTVNSTEFVMIDFGITKSYRDQQGVLRPKRENCEFRGTAQYASPFAHEGHDQCPRDDLLGLLLVFFDLICGKLPWLDAVRARDKVTVADMKKKLFGEPKKLTQYVHDIAQSEMQNKASADMEHYDNFPPIAQRCSENMIDYLMGLQYEDSVDYNVLHTWLSDMLSTEEKAIGHKTNWNEVSQVNYNYRGFNWGGGSDKRADGKERLSSDPGVQQEIALSRMKYLTKLLSAYKNESALYQDDNSSASNSKKRRRSATEELLATEKFTEDTHAATDITEPSEQTEPTEQTEPVVERAEQEKQSAVYSSLAPAAAVAAPTTPGMNNSNTVTGTGTGAGTASKAKPGVDLFPEMKTITCYQAAATLWCKVVEELGDVHRQHLKKEIIQEISNIAEKHAFFQDLPRVHPLEKCEPGIENSGSVSSNSQYNGAADSIVKNEVGTPGINGSVAGAGAGAAGASSVTAEAADIAWSHMTKVAYANKIFRQMRISVLGDGVDRSAGMKKYSFG